ncbi:MAG TPA: triose-phosphate isomerase [Gammaproteobacteria bacterium]|jgi:triosephosphate isomerase|nr:triose-phosphate isomerase [Gammaproteobacteria bacterium]
MRTPIVAGNWKLNGTRESAVKLATEVVAGATDAAVEVIVCPVYVHLAEVQQMLQEGQVKLGAQDAAAQESGAFTGEVSAPMLAEYGCGYVILGHSERRSLFGDSDEVVVEKFLAVQKAGLTPILCVGEQLDERESGVTEAVVGRQLGALLERAGADVLENAVVAYEPVWAIGTGKTATPQQAQDVHAFIRQKVGEHNADVAAGLRILYGGSVKPGNAAELFGMTDIDGGLIGGAALDSQDFLAICQAASGT